MESNLPRIGQIIHDFRIANDIGVEAFAVSIGRAKKFCWDLEKRGRCQERSWGAIARVYPKLREIIIREIGYYPPQKYTKRNQ